MPAPQNRFNCVCGGSYASQAGLRQHQRRYCRGAPTSDDNRCPICSNSYNTYNGMRQHMRLSHPAEYNADLEAESGGARSAWTEDEENVLAKAEAEYDGEDLYNHLRQFTQRTRDAIKGRRRLTSYKEKVRRFREQIMENQQIEGNHESSIHIQRIEATLKEFISNIPAAHLDETANNIREIVLNGQTDAAKQALDDWTSTIIGRNRRRPRGNNNHQNRRNNIIQALRRDDIRARVKRRLEYRLAQEEFKTDLKAYADRLLDGRDIRGSGVSPSTEEFVTLCNEIFSTPSGEDTEQIKDLYPEQQDISYPISLQELEAAIKTSKSNAAGTDGMSITDLTKIPKFHLLLLFNSMLLLGHVPSCLKIGRTIFIPKRDKDLHLVGNWRPLTITPVLIRTLNRILASRFSSVSLNSSQRGFTKVDGCFANYAAIETMIKRRRKKGQPLSLIFLDLSKAFDMVSQHSIGRALRRLNIDPVTRRFIDDSYKNCTTIASCESNNIGEFAVRRGVKQGDPHSPFLFNAVIDELLCALENKSGVGIGPTSKVCSLAYADDIVIAATNPTDAQRMLDEAVEFFGKRGLHVNATKCSSLVFNTVPSKKKVYIATEPIFKIGNEEIKTITIGEAFTYLGHQFTTKGLAPCNAESLNDQLSRIKRAPLKPQQKFCILSRFLIPRYISSLQRPNINRKTLKEVDKKIRATARAILSLFQHCNNSILYTPQKYGGLGLFNFTANIPIIILSRWEKLRERSQLMEDTYRMSSSWVQRLQKLIPPDATTKEEVKEKFRSELEGSFSGGIANVQHHRACRNFISNPPKYWTGQDYIRAINLRFNLLPCKSMPSIPTEERLCRAGCDKSESLAHILQRCPLTHWPRIKRHDFIVKRIRTAATRRNWNVQIEPHIRCRNGSLKKPDILMKKGNKVIICDVGVHWEGRTSLEDQYHNKVSIYSTEQFVERTQELYPDCEILILPFIIGARGTWCALNRALERELQLDFCETQDIITTTMRGSWMIHQYFMRSVWRGQERPDRAERQN